MAKISLIQTAQGPFNIYSVTNGVGPGRPNGRLDVLLTQYFLREIFKNNPDFKTRPFPGGVLAVDGVAGPQTFSAIRHFQDTVKTMGFPISQDGRVDPPVGEQFRGSISHTQYTIIYVNFGYREGRPQDWPRVSQAGDCPGELRQSLREPKFIGT